MSSTLLIDDAVARELAEAEGVCIRPQVRIVTDRENGRSERVAIPCGATLETKCASCARHARRLRMHQCTEGWHLDSEPERAAAAGVGHRDREAAAARRVRSTRRRRDALALPDAPMARRTVGQTFEAPDGRVYRPSMFVTLTLPSYGTILSGRGTPADPAMYNYRRAALDALLFPRLIDQFWKALRRCAGFDVQYFSAIEPQRRLAPHLHAAIRGAIPRQLLRQVARAVYVQVWWPSIDREPFADVDPVWTGTGYADPRTGELLPTWAEALDHLDRDPQARPFHVLRLGRQLDVQGIIAPSEEADRAVRYLAKYLTKSMAEPIGEGGSDASEAHADRLLAELRYLPCSEDCTNWLRYGVQPRLALADQRAGHCPKKHHDRDHLGIGGRRVLVSRKWSGKTLRQHRADRASVVHAALSEAGLTPPDIERLSATVTDATGRARFVWSTPARQELIYSEVILASVQERRRWRAEYDKAIARAPTVQVHVRRHDNEGASP